MTKKKDENIDYETLKSELEGVLEALQHDDIGVDKALEYYRRGLELTGQLETYLKTAENTVNELKAKFDAAGK